MFERFTLQARDIVIRARREARDAGCRQTGTQHLLLGLLGPGGGVASVVLRGAGLERDQVRAEIDRFVPADRLADADADVNANVDAAALEAIGIDLDAVRSKIEEAFGPGALDALKPTDSGERRALFRRRAQGCTFTPRAKKVLELSLREALHLRHNYIGTEHILLGLLRERRGLAARILTDAGVDLDELRRRTIAAVDRAA